MGDVFNDALNAPAGQLAEVLMKKVTKGDGTELADDVRMRLDRLLDTPGKPGLLARVRLAADLPYLFDRAPDWTKSRLIPLFDWLSPEAAHVWSGRQYSTYIGSPELFDLLKKPFLEMFGRSDTPIEELRTFAEWLTTILIANQADNAGYPLASTEARSALRHAGASVLSTVSHRLAMRVTGDRSRHRVVELP